ncbi:MAG: zinc metallopeptidase [Verrucomicrobiota bacterium]|jgi:Zn-dependent membrane protease YugP|nr:peptidase [Pedosphaera sp.]MEC9129791.1 zinc metallopeptidase [Verrucomicrobiota bacterium]HBF04418.1 peptidase [Verrucomicrobiales bacterium]
MYWILFIGTLLMGLWAQTKVKGAYRRQSQIRAHNGYSGAQVAAQMLQRAGIQDVGIEMQRGMLSDHYNPTRKRLVLSEENYHGTSVAAIAVAAHECGHALQHQQAYGPLNIRMASVGITSFANGMLTWLMVGALFLGLIPIQLALPLLVGCWGIIMAFNLITLPVEFDASRRAKVMLTEMGFTATATEDRGVSEVLNAAAWTYVAAFITSLAYFLYYLLPFLTGRSDD